MSEFKYLGCVVDESGTDVAECRRKLGCARMLHEKLLQPVLLYSSEAIVWREKERSRVRAVHYADEQF